jgi:hypothetical protein
LSIGQFHGNPPSIETAIAATTEAPQWRSSRRGGIPLGPKPDQDPFSTAPFGRKSQSFLDHLAAAFRAKASANAPPPRSDPELYVGHAMKVDALDGCERM